MQRELGDEVVDERRGRRVVLGGVEERRRLVDLIIVLGGGGAISSGNARWRKALPLTRSSSIQRSSAPTSAGWRRL